MKYIRVIGVHTVYRFTIYEHTVMQGLYRVCNTKIPISKQISVRLAPVHTRERVCEASYPYMTLHNFRYVYVYRNRESKVYEHKYPR
jgi:hypothetical protein